MSEYPVVNSAQVRHGYAQIGGVRIHYAEKGTGGPLVLLLHGFPECWYSWRHQLNALGDRFHVVAPDLRGYNLSDKPARVEDYRVDAVVGDVLGLIHHFGQQKAAIVGHDWGAVIAWAVAARHPEYVWKLAALQVPPTKIWRSNMSWRQALRSWYMLLFQLPHIPEWLISANNFRSLERTFKNSSVKPHTFTDVDIDVYKAALRQPGALTGALNYYRANLTRLFGPHSGKPESELIDDRLRVPTLFIFGERDFAILPETVRGIESYIDAPYREVRLPTSGHWVQQEAANEVSSALLSFLEAA